MCIRDRCERSENALFEIDSELRNRPGAPAVWGYVVDIRDAAEMSRILARHGPSAIFHAAAHKHVPLMERSPAEAIRNNVLGTKAIADMAGAGGVGTFVFISTDKAVGPSSVMGATKRIGEMYVLGLGSEFPRTRFVAVRFGNVLGSSGSVLPIFRKQIEAGGPVTVTHPDMERFFMTIPEAVALVIAAAATGRSGDLMALNMGEPIRIVDFARDLIRLSGLEPGRDIEITFTGIRPGEKLKESLAGPGESLEPSGQEGVSIVKSELPPRARVVEAIAALERLARDENGMSAEELRERLLGILRELERAG
ncbi:MAG: polysaccharide biosynthesis protein, partial [Planctomycetota bacterium]|nr:polysaccharide biosynthesis protein [Planctomycetota bacterium]